MVQDAVDSREQGPLSEETHYRDEGCEVAPSCLSCPLPRCKYDDPGAARRYLASRRNREVLVQFETGAEVMELAGRYGLSRRSIYRVIREARAEYRDGTGPWALPLGELGEVHES